MPSSESVTRLLSVSYRQPTKQKKILYTQEKIHKSWRVVSDLANKVPFYQTLPDSIQKPHVSVAEGY